MSDVDQTTLTLGFSTMGNRLDGLLTLLKKLPTDKVEVVVVVQSWDKTQQRVEDDWPQIKFVWTDTIGLSRSRNIAVQTSTSTFMWLLDDDVDIEADELEALIELLEQADSEVAVFRVRVGCTENRAGFYKVYNQSDRVTKLSLLRMNSIELLLRRQFVVQNGLTFNPNIGLGSPFPGGEEIHFLLDLFEAGGKIECIHRAFVYHSCLEGGRRKAESDEIMEIRGATASRLGLMGPALIFRWCIRYLIRDKRLGVVKSLLKGFVKGYRAYS